MFDFSLFIFFFLFLFLRCFVLIFFYSDSRRIWRRQSCTIRWADGCTCQRFNHTGHIVWALLCHLRTAKSRLRVHKNPGADDLFGCVGDSCNFHKVNAKFYLIFFPRNGFIYAVLISFLLLYRSWNAININLTLKRDRCNWILWKIK